MKKFSFLFIVAAIAFTACKKETAKCSYTSSSQVATMAETDSLQRYVAANDPLAIKDPSGVFYKIGTPGTGDNPNLCSYISMTYAGYLFSGSSFTNGPQTGNFYLGDLIEGWRKTLPLLKAGGSITLYIPPSLAYGPAPRVDNNGNVVIPANSYLRFVIDLSEVR